MPLCNECNSILDDYEIYRCNACIKDQKFKEDLERLDDVLSMIENSSYDEVDATYYDYDDDNFYVVLKNCEDGTEETFTVDRINFNVKGY